MQFNKKKIIYIYIYVVKSQNFIFIFAKSDRMGHLIYTPVLYLLKSYKVSKVVHWCLSSDCIGGTIAATGQVAYR